MVEGEPVIIAIDVSILVLSIINIRMVGYLLNTGYDRRWRPYRELIRNRLLVRLQAGLCVTVIATGPVFVLLFPAAYDPVESVLIFVYGLAQMVLMAMHIARLYFIREVLASSK
jgi:hypothetical protein